MSRVAKDNDDLAVQNYTTLMEVVPKYRAIWFKLRANVYIRLRDRVNACSDLQSLDDLRPDDKTKELISKVCIK